jgi:hypothetical protein
MKSCKETLTGVVESGIFHKLRHEGNFPLKIKKLIEEKLSRIFVTNICWQKNVWGSYMSDVSPNQKVMINVSPELSLKK